MSHTFADHVSESPTNKKKTFRTLVEILFYLHTFHLTSHSQTIILVAREGIVF